MQVAWSQAKCSCGFFQFHLQPNASPPLKKRNIAACRGQAVPPPFCFCLGQAHGGSPEAMAMFLHLPSSAERLPTPSICADVCLPRDILKIKQCQVCPIDPCSFSQWTPRATLGASLNTFIHGFCSVIIIIRT